MKLINATTGKVGFYAVGPKLFLNEKIQLGEIALCIARDIKNPTKPSVWLIGGVEQIIDYVSLSRSEDILPEESCTHLLAQIDAAKKEIPVNALTRFATIMSINDFDELKNILDTAQIHIVSPVTGVKDFSGIDKYTKKYA